MVFSLRRRHVLIATFMPIFVLFLVQFRAASRATRMFYDEAPLLILPSLPTSLAAVLKRSIFSAWPREAPRVDDSCEIIFRNNHDNRALCYLSPWGENFEAELGPAVVKRILEYELGCSSDDLPTLNLLKTSPPKEHPGIECFYSVGTLFSSVRDGDHVWGIGGTEDAGEYCAANVQNVTMYSVRGYTTAKMAHKQCSSLITPKADKVTDNRYGFEIGDPAFLMPFLYPEFNYEPQKASRSVCIVPHHYDKGAWNWDLYTKGPANATVIVVDQSWEDFMSQLLDCQRVIASALYGLVLADALGIPAHWVRFKPRVKTFSYFEYSKALPVDLQRTKTPKMFSLMRSAVEQGVTPDPIQEIIDGPIPPTIPYQQRSDFARRLLNTFPVELFSTRPAQEEESADAEAEHQIELYEWPTEPPKVLPTCQVVFRDATMALCHMVPWGSNFGDEIGPAVIRRILENEFHCSTEQLPVLDLFKTEPFMEHPGHTCLFSVGSLWHTVRSNDHVWGTGSLGRQEDYCPAEHNVVNVTVYSVRGPKSAKRVDRDCKDLVKPLSQQVKNRHGFETVGDPGFLIPFIFPEYKYQGENARMASCIIPHHYDKGGWDWKRYPEDQILHVEQPWEYMVSNMVNCGVIISSSLHGLVLADAYGIPALWLRVKPRVKPFKFGDYYLTLPSSHNRQQALYIQKELRDRLKNGTLQDEDDPFLKITRADMVEPISYEKRNIIATRIIRSFPFHLFTTRATPKEDLPVDIFPKEPPQVSNGCRVKFIDPSMHICHILAWGANFGDALGPVIVKRILELQFGCSAEEITVLDVLQTNLQHPGRCFFSVGSVWHAVQSNDVVWGSGSKGEEDFKDRDDKPTSVTVYSAQGPRTAALINTYIPDVLKPLSSKFENRFGFDELGEPSFLVPFLFPEYKYDPMTASKEFCLVPHHYDSRGWDWGRYPEDQILRVNSLPWNDFLRSMVDCKFLVVSDLQAMAVADAFGIPLRWFRWKKRAKPYMFEEYFESLPRTHVRTQPNYLPSNVNDQVKEGSKEDPVMKVVVSETRTPAISFKDRSVLAYKILRSFPFDLFTTEGDPPSDWTPLLSS